MEVGQKLPDHLKKLQKLKDMLVKIAIDSKKSKKEKPSEFKSQLSEEL